MLSVRRDEERETNDEVWRRGRCDGEVLVVIEVGEVSAVVVDDDEGVDLVVLSRSESVEDDDGIDEW